MRSKKWKITALVLASAILGTACGQTGEEGKSLESGKESYFNETGFPIVNEEITLKILCCASATTTVDFEDMEGWKYLEELMGINFEIESYPVDDLYDKMPLIMSDPDAMPDIFLQCGMSGDDLLTYGQQGLLLDLTDLIEKYGTNIKKCFETQPLNRSYARSTDGAIYGLPSYNDYGVPVVYPFAVNKRWMENCGITEFPTNVDEFKEMLIAFRDMDANGNGDPNDEIPLFGNNNVLYMFLGESFDMPIAWPYVGVQYGVQYGESEAVPLFMTDNYRSLIEFMNELYEENLVNQDLFSVSSDETTARRLADRYGVMCWYNATASEKYNPNEWEPLPLMGSEYMEEPRSYVYVTPAYQTGMGMISSNTKYPEACIRFLDYVMSIDGTALFINEFLPNIYKGDYDLEAAGVSKEIIEMYAKELEKNGGDVSMARSNITGCMGCLWLYQFKDYAKEITEFSNYSDKEKALKMSYAGMEFYNPTHTISFNEEEQEIVSAYKSDIDAYVSETVSRWYAGEEDLNDETWNAYIKELKSMHVDELTKPYVSAHNRFNGVE